MCCQIFHPFVAFLATTPMVGDGGELPGPVFDLLSSSQVNVAPDVPVILASCENDAGEKQKIV